MSYGVDGVSVCTNTLVCCREWRASSRSELVFFFFNDTATTEIYTLSLHDALPISRELPYGSRWIADPYSLFIVFSAGFVVYNFPPEVELSIA